LNVPMTCTLPLLGGAVDEIDQVFDKVDLLGKFFFKNINVFEYKK